jgi:CMP/dCMP kinase
MTIDTTHLKYPGNVCISGLTAAGKTTHCLLLSGEFGLTFVSGSQVRLFQSGVFPIQQKDFWVTAEGKSLWKEEVFERVEVELLRLESLATGYVFDTFTMPWLHRAPSLCIWLESDLSSRAIKSLISHRGLTSFTLDTYAEKIRNKDDATLAIYKRLYDISIEANQAKFDLVFDISSFITGPSLDGSLRSIARAHRLIRAATGYYLTRTDAFLEELRREAADNAPFILHNSLL